MYRLFARKFHLISNNCTKISPVLIDRQTCALLRLPINLCQTAYFSEETKPKEIKSPLGNLIAQNAPPAPEVKEEETEEKKEKTKSKFGWKTSLGIFGVTFTCIGSYLVLTLGAPGDENEMSLHADIADKPVWLQYLIRTYRELDFYAKLIQEPSRQKLLPDPLEYPYLQPKYTLVLEITDVLVHPDWTYNTGWRFKKRPGLDYFLESLHGVYEIVIYTAEQGMTLFPLCEAIDPKNIIAYKLPRDTTYFSGGHHVKSLDKLNRDLNKVIAVDWNPKSVKFHPDNLLQIKRWTGDDNDRSMIDLAAFLKSIAENDIEDVREVLQHYKAYDDPIEAFKEKRKMLIDQLEAEAAAKRDQDTSQVKKWRPSFFSR